MAHIRELDASPTDLTGSDLSPLHSLEQLRMLDLSGTNTEDGDVEAIARLDYLNCCLLSDTRITIAGLEYLATEFTKRSRGINSGISAEPNSFYVRV